jgi:DNA adenine methylase
MKGVNGVPRPIVKWAGGKSQLIESILANVPETYHTYFEPFFGGGAVFFALYKKGKIHKAVISDINPEIINMYLVVRDEPSKLLNELKKLSAANTSEQYYKLRSEFNELSRTGASRVWRAALFIYLNKTCYNGLWRVNKKGEFNVPFGRYKNPSILDKTNLLAVSEALKNVEIQLADFKATVKATKKGDFVYFDPPYAPLSKTAKFTSYTKEGFENGEQERLAKTFEGLAANGIYVLESNSDMSTIRKLYTDFEVATVKAKRFVNCKGDLRGEVNELLIKSY